ncbi:hypothetical protein DDE83_005780 [Stemphylium lycopersici]|uniref:DUF7888 domain-containing protein n=1 Tax=Stemphylium lycopersici TaxID=183478 RepID=A0A364N0V7_STELY|nr:hypothetical protein DDE83_005780 [Stemphylium lycopersici]
MKFQLITALLAGAAAASPLAHETVPELDLDISAKGDVSLEKRVIDPVSIAIIGGVVSGVVGVAATNAVDGLKSLANWDDAREAFTKATVNEMNKSRKPNEAAICYNMAYDIKKPNQVRELASVQFKSGFLKTDYDCFFMYGPDNAFWSRGDGGFINVAIQAGNQCSYDGKTGDVYCP